MKSDLKITHISSLPQLYKYLLYQGYHAYQVLNFHHIIQKSQILFYNNNYLFSFYFKFLMSAYKLLFLKRFSH